MINPLHRSLTIAFLAVSIFISGLTVDLVAAQNTAVGSATTQSPTDPLLSRYIKFDRLTAEDGLSSDQTWELSQDKRGFMWFGTANGLNRFDGASVKVYRHDPDDPNSLIHDLVWSAVEDRAGSFWIGAGVGRWRRPVPSFDKLRRQQ